MFSGGSGSGVSSYTPSSSSLGFARRRPAVVALGAVASGVALGQTAFVSHWWWLAAALVLSIALLSVGRRRLVVSAVALGALALISAFRAGHQAFSDSDRHIRRLADTNQTYTLFVTISDWPDVREQRTLLTVDVDSVRLGGVTERRFGGLLLNIGVATHDFQYSDQLILSGRISAPRERRNPGGFDYARYLRWRNIFGIVYLPHHFGIQRNPETPLSVGGVVRTVRGFILNVFRENLEAEQSALASGFLIGETAGISDRVYHHFRNSGTLHLLAVSGSNVAIALLAVRLFLWPFPLSRRTIYLALIAGAVLFCFVSHNEPSVVRATVMVCLYLVGRALQRPIDYHNIIAAAGIVILLWNPQQLFDVGFQLSFIVAWAIILVVQGLTQLAGARARRRWFRYLALPLAVSLAAQLAAAPLTLHYFGRAPLWSTVANIVIGPVVAVAVGWSMIVLAVALIVPLGAALVGAGLNLWLSLTLFLLELFGGPHAPQLTSGGVPSWLAPLALAIFLLAGGALTSRRLRRALVWSCAVAPLVFAGLRLVATGGEPPLAELFASRSGICALVTGRPPALILADLEGEPEQIFINTVAPQLRRSAADTAALVNLSSDYTTLAVSLITLDSFPATTLYVSADAERLLADELSRSGREGLASRCRSVGEFASVSDSAGLHLGRSAALLRSERGAVLFVAEQIREAQLGGALGRLQGGPAGSGAVVVASRPTRRLLDLLEAVPVSGSWRLVFQRRNPQMPLPEFGGAPVVYLSESGALRLRARAEPIR